MFLANNNICIKLLFIHWHSFLAHILFCVEGTWEHVSVHRHQRKYQYGWRIASAFKLKMDIRNYIAKYVQMCLKHLLMRPLNSFRFEHEQINIWFPWCISGSLSVPGIPKHYRYSRRMRNPQFYVSGKRSIVQCLYSNMTTIFATHLMYPRMRIVYWYYASDIDILSLLFACVMQGKVGYHFVMAIHYIAASTQ